MSASAQYPVSKSPGATFLGLARAFRARILTLALEAGPPMRAISADAMRQFKRRSGSLRPETLITIERQWRNTCNDCCLDLVLQRDKKTISISDARVTASKITYNYGESDETALSIMVSTLIIGTTRIETDSTTVAALNLHSLARRYQRGFGNASDAAILRDVQALAAAVPNLIPDHPFAISTPSEGAWRGFCVAMLDDQGVSRQIANVSHYEDTFCRRERPG